jgi:hypothetical protein
LGGEAAAYESWLMNTELNSVLTRRACL